jgi:hypothetical protein
MMYAQLTYFDTQLDENLAALAVGQLPALSLAEAPGTYWAQRAARPWH